MKINKDLIVEGTNHTLGDIPFDISDVYSTSEVKTNKVWINGKPIYRKVIQTNVDNNINATIPYYISNVDCMWINNTQSVILGSGEALGVNWYYGAEDFCRTWINFNQSSIRFRCASKTIGSRPTYIVLEYTKSTD